MTVGLTAYVYTANFDQTRRLYEGALDIKPAFEAGDWLPLAVGGGTFALHRVRSGSDHVLERFNISFTVDDIDAALARFEKAGARILRGVADEAFGKRALVQDPDGRQLEIVQHDA